MKDISYLNNYAITKSRVIKANKIISGVQSGKINKDNLYSEVSKFTKNIYSDHSLSEWTILADVTYKILNGEEII